MNYFVEIRVEPSYAQDARVIHKPELELEINARVYRVSVRGYYLAETCGCARRRELGLPFSLKMKIVLLKCVTKGGYKLKDIYVDNM
ncbi:hypothetical protein LXL04_034568 [Taraxacum kok-saghyz]